ncbi:hypothetical protein [Aureispira anguillae]|uniref:Uncharacterized protein n=1 Tax=Aureispira anguillae TaxID=2864201 RepID=A0A916DV00_9BACT|nr:hypothetical protein [Aureispira anguillae]BDS13000.1 hypothetical protein AsAng_0037280 [Aureispira anguillae]
MSSELEKWRNSIKWQKGLLSVCSSQLSKLKYEISERERERKSLEETREKLLKTLKATEEKYAAAKTTGK